MSTEADALRYCDSLADFCYQCKGPNHINDGSKCPCTCFATEGETCPVHMLPSKLLALASLSPALCASHAQVSEVLKSFPPAYGCPQCALNKLTELEEIATELRSALSLLMMRAGKEIYREPVIRAEESIDAFDVFMEEPCWSCGVKHKGRDCECNCSRDTNENCPIH